MTKTNGFESLKLRSELLENLPSLGYKEMTTIQAESLPVILKGQDVLARAKTGSGKTAAFALGALNKINPTLSKVQSLILCPTRELANQVTEETRRLAKRIPNVRVLCLCGGNPMGPQLGSLKRGAHIVVGTPGRLLKHLEKETLLLGNMSILILDEADRMLDMGFSEEIETILEYVPRKRQTLLFSATYPDVIADISEEIQKEPVEIDVRDREDPAEIEEYWSEVEHEDRLQHLHQAIEHWGGTLNIVFCNTKLECTEIAKYLVEENIVALAIHGDLEQSERTVALIQFSNESATVLVATDVAARGLDIGKVDVVFNYELPKQPEVYVHRIGRTGRAGRAGRAVSLVTSRELRRLKEIERQFPDHAIEEFAVERMSGRVNALIAPMATIEISGGRRNKLSPGDFLGALTSTQVIPGNAVGKIDVLESKTFIALKTQHQSQAVRLLNQEMIKGNAYRARSLSQGAKGENWNRGNHRKRSNPNDRSQSSNRSHAILRGQSGNRIQGKNPWKTWEIGKQEQ